MKTTSKHYGLFALLTGVILMIGCDQSSPTRAIPATEKVTNSLKATPWKINSVMVDGVSSTFFTGMNLTFTNTNYSSTNATPVWPVSGNWSFTNDAAKAFKRSDGVEVTIDAISETSLALSLNWNKTTLGSGRSESIRGKYIFTFRK